jgi:Lon protease-like protein
VLELYPVGCAGRLVRCLETNDERYVVLLQGVMRFRLEEEVEPLRGYRRARVGYGGFQGDREEVVAEEGLELEGLWQALEEVAEISESFRERLAEMSPIRQLNHLSAGLPLAPQEKQALLEAATAEERLGLLVELVRTGLAERGVDERWRTN